MISTRTNLRMHERLFVKFTVVVLDNWVANGR
jgi:hypothetical protein